MKHDGEAAKTLFGMSKGKIPFDPGDGERAPRRRSTKARRKSAALFPDNSKTGGGTRRRCRHDLGEQAGLRRPLRPIREGRRSCARPELRMRRHSSNSLPPCSRTAAAVTNSTRPKAAET